MSVEPAPEDDPRRIAVREWIAANPEPTGRQLAEAGYVVPHWPEPWGLDADPIHQLLIDEELRRARIRRPVNLIGIGWACPTIIMAGTRAQIDRYVWPALAGEEIWCQLFSEPDAGSDLASLRLRARRDGDHYVLSGSKTWTSGGHFSDLGILIARTDPGAPPRQGISYFICPMDLPGMTLTPTVDMTGGQSFNEVHFDDARLPAEMLVGEENDGWRLAKVTLGNERAGLSSGGVLWGSGPTASDLLDLVRRNHLPLPPVLRDRLARLHIESETLRLLRLRSLGNLVLGRPRGPEISVQKLLADEHGQRVMALAREIAGADGMLVGAGPRGELPGRSRSAPMHKPPIGDQFPDVEPIWEFGWRFAPALTIGGGTAEIQRNIIAERTLGLPPEPAPR